MIGDMLQQMTAGKVIEYEGVRFILLSNTMLRIPDGRALFVAVKESDTFPAQTYLIPGDPRAHFDRSNQD